MQQTQRVLCSTLMISLLAILASCTGSSIPVIEKNGNSSTSRQVVPTSGSHTVKRGESLYSIAWMYGTEMRQLAALNSLQAPYVIYPGEKLRIKPGRGSATAKRHSAHKPTKKVSAVGASKIVSQDKQGWRWPVEGNLLQSFGQGSTANKGIDIAGRTGQSVYTARPGRVVYSGNGIRGYGNLLIVKHSSEFLSAYAYNSRLLVKEGDVVKEGQKIAEIGSSGIARTAKLHFEIRKSGKPVNPLALLPNKGGKNG